MYGPEQIEFLKEKQYLKKDETITERIDDIVNVVKRYEKDYSEGLGERIRGYITKQILSPSTPQWANLGRKEEEGTSPLPASCYIISPQDSIQGIYYSIAETAMMSKLGGGIGASLLDVSDKGTKIEEGFYTNPKLDWAEDIVRTAKKVSQNAVRRGYSVPYISITDPEFYDLLKRTDKKNSDKNDPFVTNTVGIVLPTGFWEDIKTDKELQERFLLVMQIRMTTGKVYLLDVDNCNKNQSPVYKTLGQVCNTSNICTEIISPSYSDKSFVCVIASLNLKHWDTIKADPQIIKDAYMFLDINVSEYIRLTEGIPFLEKARKSAIEKRDIGLGTLGFHEYLQSHGMEFGGLESRFVNKEIYSTLRKVGEEYTKEIGEKLGSPEMCQLANMIRRNVSLMMIAPNKSTSFICGATSLGIEPFLSNYFVKALAGIQSTFKNPWLVRLLELKGKSTPEVWQSILENIGSVQHLDFLTTEEKNIFKTANEISPKDMIDLASDRQVYIDMSQSLNLWNRPNYELKDVYDIHKYAFSKGIKTVYYFYPQVHSSIEKEGESWETCASCAD